ncbi:hypothetical protein ACJ6WD_09840 [Streptomyces sp. VTCC 41912]|uniref:hypothetical protein n=1 Tax=Streptomyces sp. VTCC 41912 TaxID=3383243 RepID=UPI003896EA5C
MSELTDPGRHSLDWRIAWRPTHLWAGTESLDDAIARYSDLAAIISGGKGTVGDTLNRIALGHTIQEELCARQPRLLYDAIRLGATWEQAARAMGPGITPKQARATVQEWVDEQYRYEKALEEGGHPVARRQFSDDHHAEVRAWCALGDAEVRPNVPAHTYPCRIESARFALRIRVSGEVHAANRGESGTVHSACGDNLVEATLYPGSSARICIDRDTPITCSQCETVLFASH